MYRQTMRLPCELHEPGPGAYISTPGTFTQVVPARTRTFEAPTHSSDGESRLGVPKREPVPIECRNAVFDAYDGRCLYCAHRTWHHPLHPRASLVLSTMGVRRIDGVLRRRLLGLMGTMEHLIRVADGGTNAIENLALACHECNSMRHDASVEGHMSEIRMKVLAGQHPNWGAARKPAENLFLKGPLKVEEIAPAHVRLDVPCPICDDSFESRFDMTRHCSNRHGVDLESRSLVCEVVTHTCMGVRVVSSTRPCRSGSAAGDGTMMPSHDGGPPRREEWKVSECEGTSIRGQRGTARTVRSPAS